MNGIAHIIPAIANATMYQVDVDLNTLSAIIPTTCAITLAQFDLITAYTDEETGQTIIAGMCERHL